MEMDLSRFRGKHGRPPQQLDGFIDAAAQPCGMAGEMQYIDIVGMLAHEFAINALGVGKLSAFFQSERRLEPVYIRDRERAAARARPPPPQQVAYQFGQHYVSHHVKIGRAAERWAVAATTLIIAH